MRSLSFALAFVCLCFPVQAQTVGDIATGTLKLESSVNRNLYIPLPPGEWRIVADWRWRSPAEEDVPMRRMRLVNVIDKIAQGVITIWWNLQNGKRLHYLQPQICFFKERLFYVAFNPPNEFLKNAFDCTYVGHIVGKFDRDATRLGMQFNAWVSDNKIRFPSAMATTHFSMFDGAQLLTVDYWLRVEPTSGGRNPTASSSQQSPRFAPPPELVPALEKQREWAKGWRERVASGLKGVPAAD